jgi:hypothetical protein
MEYGGMNLSMDWPAGKEKFLNLYVRIRTLSGREELRLRRCVRPALSVIKR